MTIKEKPVISIIKELRCKKCNRKLGENLNGTIEIVCPRCGHYNNFK